MKWGKLVANLNNATHAITGYWLERGMAEVEMRALMLEVREEGLRVLEAAGIAVEPPAGEPSPIRIRRMTEKLKLPPDPSRNVPDLPEEQRTYASMWQDLVLGRPSSEADFLNGEIVALGRKLGIPTPYNSTLLEIVNRMFDNNLKPGIHTPAELRALIRRRPADAEI
jgi:2-dehydropantoate 2-reductase